MVCFKSLCDDCNIALKTIDDDTIDLVVTDPPYGISFRSNRQRVDRKVSVEENQSIVVRPHYFNKIHNDNGISDLSWLTECFRVLKDKSALYVFAHWSHWGKLERDVAAAGFQIKNMIVLNKSNHGMGDLKGSYAPKHELMLFATKGRHVLRFPNGRGKDVWDVPVLFSGSHKCHPNQKPLSWVIPPILNSSDEDQVVLDPFMGSGTTGVCCMNSRRHFIGIEKDEEYFKQANLTIRAAQGKSGVFDEHI